MHRMDVTNIYKYPQGEVLLGLDASCVGGFKLETQPYTLLKLLMADRSAAFFICFESAFSLEGARGGPRIDCLGRRQ